MDKDYTQKVESEDLVNVYGDLTMYAIAVASGVGTYLAVKLNDKFSKERTFVNVILSSLKIR